jgi:hypothetical protein
MNRGYKKRAGDGAGGTDRSTSVWMATAGLSTYAVLVGDARADDRIVVGGIAGMTSAYLLARSPR